jgi:hypothetical protein
LALSYQNREIRSLSFANSEKYSASDQFEAEREVCKVLCEEPAVLYVIDSSKPLRKIHEAEMELLMLTGLPRLAILNPTAIRCMNQSGGRSLASDLERLRLLMHIRHGQKIVLHLYEHWQRLLINGEMICRR